MSNTFNVFDGAGKLVGTISDGVFNSTHTPNFSGNIFDANKLPLGHIDSITGDFIPKSSGGGIKPSIPVGGGESIGPLLGLEAGVATLAAIALLSLLASPFVLWVYGMRTKKRIDTQTGNALIVSGFVMFGVVTAWSVYDLFRDQYYTGTSLFPLGNIWFFSVLMAVHFALLIILTISTYVSYRKLAQPHVPIRQFLSIDDVQKYRLALFIVAIIGAVTIYFLTWYLTDLVFTKYALVNNMCHSQLPDAWTLFIQSFFCPIN